MAKRLEQKPKSLEKEFENPSSLYRGKPFWAWNGDLQEDELRRQIRVMKQMGLGGFFMHSRTGLATPYLSDEWHRLCRACVDEADQQGMEAWLYDEDRWPSGAAGGIVTKDPKYRQRWVKLKIYQPEKCEWPKKPLAVFSGRIDGTSIYEVKRLTSKKDVKDVPAEHRVLTFEVEISGPRSNFNGQTYLDTLSHEAVQKFIEVTHEAYRIQMGEFFGDLIPGIFTDEPNHGGTLRGGAGGMDDAFEQESQVPWTEKLPEIFMDRYGYDLLDQLPAIFFDVDGKTIQKARHDYHDCKTFLFVDAFARQIGAWCDQNNLAHTGHVLAEMPLHAQVGVGGDAMRFYEYMQAPGIDILREGNKEYGTAKMCSSVQNQLGRRWMLSELYGCTGWDFNFESHKAVGDWQAALGVNLRCQHLSWYTMEGQAKRDYPASIFYQSPWWEQYGKVEDYFSRVGSVMAQGQAVRRLLVVNPIESVWQDMKMNGPNPREVPPFGEESFNAVLDWLLGAHVDFDFGDEEMMDRLCKVSKGDGKPRLRFAKADYDVLLLPPMLTVRSSTLKLAKRFADAGGQVIFAGEPADYVDAEASRQARSVAEKCTRVAFKKQALIEAVEAARTIHVLGGRNKEEESIFYLLHRDGEARYLFLVNTDRKQGRDKVKVRVMLDNLNTRPEEWDPQTGERYKTATRKRKNYWEIETDFPASGSRLFVIPEKQSDELKARPDFGKANKTKNLNGRWLATLSEANALVLDYPKFKVGKGKWRDAQEILRVDMAVRDAIGIDHRSGAMVQPWASEADTDPAKHRDVELEYRFEVRDVPVAACQIALEKPAECCLELNGIPVSNENECGWWVDRSIRLLPIPSGAIREGENVLRVTMNYGPQSGLEAMFVLGQFGVQMDRDNKQATMIRPPVHLNAGDWCQEGLAFYTGNVTYRQKVKVQSGKGDRVFIETPSFGGAAVRVWVDGQVAGTIAWQPYELDITDFVEGDSIELGLEVLGTRRNAFGPLHWNASREERGWTGPWQFILGGDEVTDAYVLEPHGLLEAPVVSYRR
ncbi:MAG: glycosyl hydrolase [Candidatus Sumerlaeia bacterium]